MIALIKKLIQKLTGKNVVAYICGAESLPNPLSAEEELDLAQKAKDGDDKAREKLIEHNLRLVIFIAKKFENTNVVTEDLISIGTIGLIKAVNGFDCSKKIKLATFASRCIENEILMFLRKTIRLKTEVSLDEPLNTDGEGNELLLGDVLGTDNDMIFKNLETTVEKQLLNLLILEKGYY